MLPLLSGKPVEDRKGKKKFQSILQSNQTLEGGKVSPGNTKLSILFLNRNSQETLFYVNEISVSQGNTRMTPQQPASLGQASGMLPPALHLIQM